jgi:hypothetical protein
MTSHRSAEEWVDAVNEIIRLYRGSSADAGAETISREEAVSRLRELGVSEGDAVRWLGSGN